MKNTINIQEIVNKKVESMLQDNDIVKSIESNIETAIISSIKEATSSYKVKNVIESKLENEISAQLKTLSFDNYSKKIVNDICLIIEAESNKDFSEKIKSTFSTLFMANVPKEIPVQNIADEYAKYLNGDLEYEDKPDYYVADLTFREPDWTNRKIPSITLRVKKEDDYCTSDKKIEISFTYVSNEPELYQISRIYCGEDKDKDLTKAIIIKHYSSIEKYLVNLFLNDVKIRIKDEDFGELDCYSDLDI